MDPWAEFPVFQQMDTAKVITSDSDLRENNDQKPDYKAFWIS